MQRRTLITIGIILIVALVLVISIFLRDESVLPEGETPTGTSGNLLPPVPREVEAPSGDTLTIQGRGGGVVVKNFYKNAVEANEEYVVMVQNDEFDILYFREGSSFLITVGMLPFETTRMHAEDALLALLDIIEADACKLNVSIGVPASVDPQNAGNSYGLSFCRDGIPS